MFINYVSFFLYFSTLKKAPCLRKKIPAGEMAEWSKAHAWKVCIPHKGIEGSNPSLSARLQILN
jgi:hypothetical protein